MRSFTDDMNKQLGIELYKTVHSGMTGVLVGATILEKPAQEVIEGTSDYLETLLVEWVKIGGDVEIAYKRNNFREARLELYNAYKGMRFAICQKGEEEQTEENLKKEIEGENPLRFVGIFVSTEIK